MTEGQTNSSLHVLSLRTSQWYQSRFVLDFFTALHLLYVVNNKRRACFKWQTNYFCDISLRKFVWICLEVQTSLNEQDKERQRPDHIHLSMALDQKC